MVNDKSFYKHYSQSSKLKQCKIHLSLTVYGQIPTVSVW